MAREQNGERVGARRVAKAGGGRPWWAVLLVLIVLLAVVAGAWLLFADDDEDVEALNPGDETATTAASPSTSPPSTAGRATAGPGEVFAGGQRVLPGGEGHLERSIGEPAEGRTVRVVSVPSDESFWVGSSSTNRVFVHLALSPGESAFNVEPGETVTFSGTVKAIPPDAESRFGLTEAEGLSDLRRQGAYIEATTLTNG